MHSSRLTEAELDEFKTHIEELFPAQMKAVFKFSVAYQDGTDKVVMQFPCADIFITNALSVVLHQTFKQYIELPVHPKNELEKANVIFLKADDVKTISATLQAQKQTYKDRCTLVFNGYRKQYTSERWHREALASLSKAFKTHNAEVAPIFQKLKASLLSRYQALNVSTEDPAIVDRQAQDIYDGLNIEIENAIAVYQSICLQDAANESKKLKPGRNKLLSFDNLNLSTTFTIENEKDIEARYNKYFEVKRNQFVREETQFQKKLEGKEKVDYKNEYEHLIKLAQGMLNVAPESEQGKWKNVMQTYKTLLKMECPDDTPLTKNTTPKP
jgi:hypothetical protein